MLLPSKRENFGDVFYRMYDGHFKNVTFIVGKECQLRCSYCFPAGTMIRFDRNISVRIEEVQVGDRVLGFPDDLADKVADPDFSVYQNTRRTLVTAVMDRKYSGKMIHVYLENRNLLHMTAEHPVLCERGFVPAEELRVTDCVFDSIGRRIGITAINHSWVNDLHVYNLETDLHTYFAEDTLVHNCYETHKCGDRMPFEVAKKFIDLLFDMDARGAKYVNEEDANGICLDFIGGEPLLEVELMDKICDYFVLEALRRNHRWATRYMISISTNGVAYFEPAVQHFFKKWGNKVSVGITIDGNEELHDKCRKFPDGRGSYAYAAAAFKDAIKRYGYDGTKLTIARANLPCLATAFKDMINEFGISYIQGNPVFEEEWDNEDAALYYQQIKEVADWLLEDDRWRRIGTSFLDSFVGHALPETDNQNWCGGTGKMLAVDTDGKIYPCVRYAPVSIGEKAEGAVIGDVDNGIIVTEKQCDFAHCLDCITRRSASTDECWNCPIASGCATCNAWQYDLYGDAGKRCTRICPMHKARVLATAYYYNSLWRLTRDDSLHFEMNIPPEWAMRIIGIKEYTYLLSLANKQE